MAETPEFFIVQTKPGGGEFPAICYDYIPPTLQRKIPKGADERAPLVYALRLDLLTPIERNAWGWTLTEMYATYVARRDAGTLPASNINPPAKNDGGARRALGDRWEPPAKTWDDSLPPDEYPAIEQNVQGGA